MTRLGAAKPESGDAILLDVPEIADGGARVEVRVASVIPLTDSILIVVDRGARPLVAEFSLSHDMEADVTATVRLPSTATVRALVRADGKLYTVAKEVKVAEVPAASVTKPRGKRS